MRLWLWLLRLLMMLLMLRLLLLILLWRLRLLMIGEVMMRVKMRLLLRLLLLLLSVRPGRSVSKGLRVGVAVNGVVVVLACGRMVLLLLREMRLLLGMLLLE